MDLGLVSTVILFFVVLPPIVMGAGALWAALMGAMLSESGDRASRTRSRPGLCTRPGSGGPRSRSPR